MKKRSVGKVLLLEAVVILAAFVFAMGAFRSGSGYILGYFIDIPSLLCLFLLVIPALCASGMWRDFVRVFSIGRKEYTLAQMKRSLEAVRLAQRLVLCAVGFFSVLTFVILLYNMTDLAVLGPCMAIMALTVLYGVILEFFMAPMSAHVQNCITDAMDIPEPEDAVSAMAVSAPGMSANAKLLADDDDDEED